MPVVRLAPLFALVLLAGCGGKVATESSDAAKNDDAKMPPATCSWSSTIDALDASPMRDSCRAAKQMIVCKGTDGSESTCINNEEKCPLPGNPGVMYTCTNQCKPTEFGVACGTIGGSVVVPPVDCRVNLPTPGGVVFYCCPCSS